MSAGRSTDLYCRLPRRIRPHFLKFSGNAVANRRWTDYVISNSQNRFDHCSTWQIVSDDGGKTWRGLHQVADGFPPHLLKLHDGRLLMSYSYRRKPYGNRCRVSCNEGESWSEPIIISDDGASADLGYTSTAELSDGTLVTVWYEFRPDKGAALLRSARWRFQA